MTVLFTQKKIIWKNLYENHNKKEIKKVSSINKSKDLQSSVTKKKKKYECNKKVGDKFHKLKEK